MLSCSLWQLYRSVQIQGRLRDTNAIGRVVCACGRNTGQGGAFERLYSSPFCIFLCLCCCTVLCVASLPSSLRSLQLSKTQPKPGQSPSLGFTLRLRATLYTQIGTEVRRSLERTTKRERKWERTRGHMSTHSLETAHATNCSKRRLPSPSGQPCRMS